MSINSISIIFHFYNLFKVLNIFGSSLVKSSASVLFIDHSSKIVSEAQTHKEDIHGKIEEMTRKIKYYQDDNLRLSSELVKLSNKLENTKNQLQLSLRM